MSMLQSCPKIDERPILEKKCKYIGLKNCEEMSFYSWKCGVVLALFYLAEVHVEKHIMIVAIAKEMSFIQL